MNAIQGAPGSGKTVIAASAAIHWALPVEPERLAAPVLFLVAPTSQERTVLALVAAVAKLPEQDVREGRIRDCWWAHLAHSAGVLAHCGIRVFAPTGRKQRQRLLHAFARACARRNLGGRRALVVIDGADALEREDIDDLRGVSEFARTDVLVMATPLQLAQALCRFDLVATLESGFPLRAKIEFDQLCRVGPLRFPNLLLPSDCVLPNLDSSV